MKRLMCILLLLSTVFFVSACEEEVKGHGSILLENECLETTFSRETDEGGYVYVLNIATHKYHLQTCEYAISMREENRYETSSMHYIIERDYQPCKICIGG